MNTTLPTGEFTAADPATPSGLVLGLASNNVISRFPCQVPSEHRAEACWGTVEKANVPLTPVVVFEDGTIGDACWFCLTKLSPALDLLHHVFDQLDPMAQTYILDVLTAEQGPDVKVYATTNDMWRLVELVVVVHRVIAEHTAPFGSDLTPEILDSIEERLGAAEARATLDAARPAEAY